MPPFSRESKGRGNKEKKTGNKRDLIHIARPQGTGLYTVYITVKAVPRSCTPYAENIPAPISAGPSHVQKGLLHLIIDWLGPEWAEGEGDQSQTQTLGRVWSKERLRGWILATEFGAGGWWSLSQKNQGHTWTNRCTG